MFICFVPIETASNFIHSLRDSATSLIDVSIYKCLQECIDEVIECAFDSEDGSSLPDDVYHFFYLDFLRAADYINYHQVSGCGSNLRSSFINHVKSIIKNRIV